LPNGYTGTRAFELTREEIRRLVVGFAGLGFWKVRLSGGEPSVRRDLPQIIEDVAAVPGVRRVALSTNGFRLRELCQEIAPGSLQQVNVSVDSLDREVFARVTGKDLLPTVLAGIDAALARGIAVKVNAVLLPENEDQLDAFAAFVRERPVTVRFIELMQTRQNETYFIGKHRSPSSMITRLEARGWTPRPRALGDGPATEFSHAESLGGLGFVSAYSPGFCDTCNRLRVSSTGKLRLCLFGDGAFDLRPMLADDSQRQALMDTVRARLGAKTAGHRLHASDPGTTEHLASIGG
jgi:cyclic pyranopterin phosphate synthase